MWGNSKNFFSDRKTVVVFFDGGAIDDGVIGAHCEAQGFFIFWAMR